jgi:glucuronoarabinoxylan endo-1,4-beta-xylanase
VKERGGDLYSPGMGRLLRSLVVTALGGALAGLGCGAGGGGGGKGSGGTTASGGSNATGGAPGSGGSGPSGGSGGPSASGGNGSGGSTGGSGTGGSGTGGSGTGGSGTGGSGTGGSGTGGLASGGRGGAGAGSGGAGTGGAGTGGGAAGSGVGGSGAGGSGAGGAHSACAGGNAAGGDVTIDLGAFLQTMDGFGISNAFQGTAISDATADQFFDPSKGIGLSIFRLGIDQNGASLGPIGDAQKAAARGAIVWAAPWTPPANCKSNGSLTNGGTLNTSCYDTWATTLAGFVATAKKSGVTVMGMSAQNEPDNTTPYDSCIFSNDQMVAFIKALGPKLKALSPPVKLVAPEATRWEDLWGGTPNKGSYSYGNAILADGTAAGQVDILATHMYETQNVMAPPAGVSKPIWVTEMSGVMGYPEAGPSSDIADGLVWAGWIRDAITIGQASAWHAWWMTSLNADNEGLLLQGGGSTKRFYTVGNYSKFIRPGYRRVTVSGTPPTGVTLTAYQNPTDGTVVVVAINAGSSAVALPLFLSGGAPCAMTPWVTSVSDNLVSKAAVSVSGSRLAPTLAAQSVTTLVGKP